MNVQRETTVVEVGAIVIRVHLSSFASIGVKGESPEKVNFQTLRTSVEMIVPKGFVHRLGKACIENC